MQGEEPLICLKDDVLFAQLFGESLVHTGNTSMGPPAYVDPYELLEAESRIPMVPFNRAPEPVQSAEKDVTSAVDSAVPSN